MMTRGRRRGGRKWKSGEKDEEGGGRGGRRKANLESGNRNAKGDEENLLHVFAEHSTAPLDTDNLAALHRDNRQRIVRLVEDRSDAPGERRHSDEKM